MFSVIIPTMWYGEDIRTMVPSLNASPAVGEIIVINNNPNLMKGLPTRDGRYMHKLAPANPPPEWYHDGSISKLVKIEPNTNIYVTPAYNAGVEISKHDQLLLLQDDISFDTNMLPALAPHITPDKGIVGGNIALHQPYPTQLPALPTELQIEEMPGHLSMWHPATMYLHKDNYKTIPDTLPIYFGEVWLCLYSVSIGKPPRMLSNVDVYHRGQVLRSTSDKIFSPARQTLGAEWIHKELGITGWKHWTPHPLDSPLAPTNWVDP